MGDVGIVVLNAKSTQTVEMPVDNRGRCAIGEGGFGKLGGQAGLRLVVIVEVHPAWKPALHYIAHRNTRRFGHMNKDQRAGRIKSAHRGLFLGRGIRIGAAHTFEDGFKRQRPCHAKESVKAQLDHDIHARQKREQAPDHKDIDRQSHQKDEN